VKLYESVMGWLFFWLAKRCGYTWVHLHAPGGEDAPVRGIILADAPDVLLELVEA
jgi:hypothetical protein